MTNYNIVLGSAEVDDTTITAGVYPESAAPAPIPEGLRYIRGDLEDAKPGETAEQFLGRVYESSTGCLLRGHFQMGQLA